MMQENQMNPDVVEFAKIIDGMFDLYQKKNANYGNSFSKLWDDLGPIAGLVPLHNKLDRLTNLVKGGKNDFESVQDTCLDLANYAIMNVIEMRKHGTETISPKKEKQILNESAEAEAEKEAQAIIANGGI